MGNAGVNAKVTGIRSTGKLRFDLTSCISAQLVNDSTRGKFLDFRPEDFISTKF